MDTATHCMHHGCITRRLPLAPVPQSGWLPVCLLCLVCVFARSLCQPICSLVYALHLSLIPLYARSTQQLVDSEIDLVSAKLEAIVAEASTTPPRVLAKVCVGVCVCACV